jgi:MFS family permease
MTAPFGIAAAALHQIVPGGIRSQATALYVMMLNVVGSATGPTLTAFLTERVFHREDALNYSLLTVHIAALSVAAILLWAGRLSFVRIADATCKERYAGPDLPAPIIPRQAEP